MICDKSKCTGCFACYNVCPKNAIIMKEDDNGFIYPEINKEKCINCGLCEKICPSVNKVEFFEKQECFAVYSKDSTIRSNSTSGGVATTLSKAFLENDGVVYGAAFVDNCNVSHIRITEEKELKKLQGSKYVHSYINDTYLNIKKDLIDGKKVLFFGTPCQVAGLNNFLIKKYNNLITIDLICHGVPSQKYLKEEVKRLINCLDITRVNFRNNTEYGFYINKDDKIVYEAERVNAPYSDSLLGRMSLRENCYSCMYTNSKRNSDITIGDFWGIRPDSKYYDDRKKGLSVVIISTEKGKELFNNFLDKFEIEKRDYSEAVNGNPQLRHPAAKAPNTDKFKRDYPKLGFYKAYKKYTKYIRFKRFVKKILKGIFRK